MTLGYLSLVPPQSKPVVPSVLVPPSRRRRSVAAVKQLQSLSNTPGHSGSRFVEDTFSRWWSIPPLCQRLFGKRGKPKRTLSLFRSASTILRHHLSALNNRPKHPNQHVVTTLANSPARDNPYHPRAPQRRHSNPTRMFTRRTRLLSTRLISYRQTYHAQSCTSHQAMRADAHCQLRLQTRPFVGSRCRQEELEP